MNEWIDCEEEKRPESVFDVCLVTDGKLSCLAYYIENPMQYYETHENNDKVLVEWDDNEECYIPMGEDAYESHWEFITDIGPFIRGDQECFGAIGEITHWMPLPKPPEMKDE